MTKPLNRLLVIDDNKSFLEHLKQNLKQHFKLFLYHSEEGKSLPDILSFINESKPDHCLIDLNLYKSGLSRIILTEATKKNKIPGHCKIWIISQAKEDNATIHQFQECNHNVQDKLLRKPITAASLSAEILDNTQFEPRNELYTTLPLPLRVLTRQGKIAYSNELWSKNSYPDPTVSSGDWGKTGKVPAKTEHVGSLGTKYIRAILHSTKGEQYSGFTLRSIEIEQDDEKFLVQIAERQAISLFPNNLNDTVDRIFDAMKLAGFTRGRFYRLEVLEEHSKSNSYKYTLELQKLSYRKPNTLTLPYCIPCEGEIKKRIDSYKIKDQDKFLYSIRNREDDDKANDPHINKLNTQLELGNICSWLEVPIWNEKIELEPNKQALTMVGLLIFDRSDSGTTNELMIDSEIDKNTIDRIEPLLSSLVEVLCGSFRQESLKKLHIYSKKMLNFDQALVSKRNETERFEEILTALCKLSGACSGIIVINEQPEQLNVVTRYGEFPDFIDKVKFPLTATKHPIVKAWKSGETKVFQNFQENEEYDILQSSLNSRDDYQHLISDHQKEKFLEWMGSFHGLISIPVQILDEKPIGAISLHFKDPNVITQSKVQQIKAVLHRARWVMQQAKNEHDKRVEYWQLVLGHDMKTNLNIVDQNLCELERIQPQLTDKREWKKAKRYLADAYDLAENWMDMMTPTLKSRIGSFQSTKALNDFIQLSKLRIEDDNIKLKFQPAKEDPVWETQLYGSEVVFGRVIRILLDNSFKFGLIADNKKETVPIDIRAKIDSSKKTWILSISNDGQMSKTAEALCFQAGNIPDDSETPGAHVGLSVAKRWIEYFGGTLLLENDTAKNLVIATLTIPTSPK